MMQLMAVIMLISFSLTNSTFWPHPSTQEPQSVPVDLANSLVEQLRSPDYGERQNAKERLVSLGPVAIKPLLELLQDIRRNPHPRFELGKEKEGKEFIDHYNRLLWQQQDIREYFSVDISSRLQADTIELLGRLKAIEAIPVLLEILRQEIHFNFNEHLFAESYALIEIGHTAIPQLTQALETAEQIANAGQFADNVDLTEEQKDDIRRDEGGFMEARLALILGRMRDRRALPSLEKLLRRDRPSYSLPYIKDAIYEITVKRD